MPSATSIRAGKAFVEAYIEHNRFDRDAGHIEARLKRLGQSVNHIGTKMLKIGAVIGGAFAGAAVHFAKTGDEIAKMAKRTGLSVQAISELKFVASQTGTEFKNLEVAFRKMQRSIYDAGRGLSTQTDALKDLGLTYQDLAGKSPIEQFEMLAESLGKVTDDTKQAAIAQSLFGRSGTNLIPMFEAGAVGIRELREEAERLGLTWSKEDAVAAEELNDALDKMKKGISQLIVRIGSALAGEGKELSEWIATSVKDIGDWIDRNRDLIAITAKVGAAIAVIGVALKGVNVVVGLVTIAYSAAAWAASKLAVAQGKGAVAAAAEAASLNANTGALVANTAARKANASAAMQSMAAGSARPGAAQLFGLGAQGQLAQAAAGAGSAGTGAASGGIASGLGAAGATAGMIGIAAAPWALLMLDAYIDMRKKQAQQEEINARVAEITAANEGKITDALRKRIGVIASLVSAESTLKEIGQTVTDEAEQLKLAGLSEAERKLRTIDKTAQERLKKLDEQRQAVVQDVTKAEKNLKIIRSQASRARGGDTAKVQQEMANAEKRLNDAVAKREEILTRIESLEGRIANHTERQREAVLEQAHERERQEANRLQEQRAGKPGASERRLTREADYLSERGMDPRMAKLAARYKRWKERRDAHAEKYGEASAKVLFGKMKDPTEFVKTMTEGKARLEETAARLTGRSTAQGTLNTSSQALAGIASQIVGTKQKEEPDAETARNTAEMRKLLGNIYDAVKDKTLAFDP